jgi:protein-disulfide isomerase
MDRRFLAILGGIIVILGAFFVINQNSSNNKSASQSTNSTAQATNNVMGENAKGVTLVEYGDYQCPVCGLYYQTTKSVVDKLKSDIKFQFRNLPITQLHPNAFAAARAAQAAAVQGKFWEMHDQLYTNQSSWASSTAPLAFFKTYAKAIGLDMTKFEKDYSSTATNDAINADIAEFNKTGEQVATPTFFINGKVVNLKDLVGSNQFPSEDKFVAVINAEIAKQNKK